MSSESELSITSSSSSSDGRRVRTDENRTEKRKRSRKIRCSGSSSDSLSTAEITVKKARSRKELNSVSNICSLEAEGSGSEDSSAKENSDNSRKLVEIKSIQGRFDNITKSSNSAVKSGVGNLVSKKSTGDVGNSFGSMRAHTDSESESHSSSTDASGKMSMDEQKTATIRKKEGCKEKLQKREESYDTSDDENDFNSKLSHKGRKAGKKSKLQKHEGLREESSVKENTDDSSHESKAEVNEHNIRQRNLDVDRSRKSVEDSSSKHKQTKDICKTKKYGGKKAEKIENVTDSELSENSGSKSSSSNGTGASDFKANKARSEHAKGVHSNKRKTKGKSRKETKRKHKDSEDSTESDSGLEGSNTETKSKFSEKVVNKKTLNSKVYRKESVSSSESDSESLIRKRNEKNTVEKYVQSHSSSDTERSEPDKENRKCLKEPSQASSSPSDDKKTTKAHSMSSSDSDSETESKASKKEVIKGTGPQKSKHDKDVDEKKTGRSMEDPHKDRAVMRAKRYVKEAGLRIQNYALLWAGCRSNKARAQAIINFLHDNGLSGTPTLEKCKRLRIKRETKSEASELDLSNIISSGRESRRTAMLSATVKPVEVDSPVKQELKNRFARIQALGDSDSSSG